MAKGRTPKRRGRKRRRTSRRRAFVVGMRRAFVVSRTPARLQLRCSASRVETQAERAVAIDVEYVHVRLHDHASARYTKLQLPAEVCLVDCHGDPVLLTVIDAVSEVAVDVLSHDVSHDGGLSFEEIEAKPLLSEVRRQLVERMEGRLVVGHNLAKDLLALGITEKMVPPGLRRDTMAYSALQNEKGCGRSLAELAEVKLGRTIQRGDRHCAAEDARATMELYLGWCHFDEGLMSYDDLVEYQVSKLLSRASNA